MRGITHATKFGFVFIASLFTLHFILRRVNDTYHNATALSAYLEQLNEQRETSSTYPPSQFRASGSCPQTHNPQGGKANATLLMLTRNSDLWSAIASVKALEDRFNRQPQHRYPWVFLNDEPFSDQFKERISALVSSKVEFGLIPRDHWVQPESIDETKATQGRWDLIWKGIIYADSISYRNMCRFNSGFFFKHELLLPYKWYWRVEPNVQYFCDLDYDPFTFMEQNNKTYGFTISMEDFRETITSLWGTVKEFTKKHPQYVAENNAMGFLSQDGGDNYNLCHFWSNFEIASLDFYRSPAYTAYFEALEATGNFYYERWGDAPVHSIAAGLFLDKKQIHFFSDIGYRHDPFQHCPQGAEHVKGKCACNPDDNYDYTGASCLQRWQNIF